jgi:hypothetical protein
LLASVVAFLAMRLDRRLALPVIGAASYFLTALAFAWITVIAWRERCIEVYSFVGGAVFHRCSRPVAYWCHVFLYAAAAIFVSWVSLRSLAISR